MLSNTFILLSVFKIVLGCLTDYDQYEQCGRPSNGNNNYQRFQPWAVSITCDYKVSDKDIDKVGHICGATIISRKHVITAAHCLQIPNVYIEKKYYLNDLNPNLESVFKVAVEMPKTKNLIYYKIKKVYLHEAFDNVTLVNDIALIELENNFDFNDGIYSVCLPDQESHDYPSVGNDAYMVSWQSKAKSIYDTGYIEMSLVYDKYCSKYSNQNLQLCAQSLKTTSACRGYYKIKFIL